MIKFAVTTSRYIMGTYVLEIGFVLEVLDKNLLPSSVEMSHYRGDEAIWVKSPHIEDGEPFTILLADVKVFDDPADIELWRTLYET